MGDTRFQPGAAWTGNRKGRPAKGKAMADLLRAQLARPYAAGQTYAQRLAEVYVQAAVDGNLEAARWVVDHTDGPLPRAAALPSGERFDGDGYDYRVEHRLTLDDDRVAAVLAYVAAQRGLLPGGG